MNGTCSIRGISSIGMVVALLLGWGVLAAHSASAVGAPIAINECNAVFNDGGRGMNCDVTVVNYLNLGTSVQRSTTTTVACDGAANTVPLPHCVTTVIPSGELVSTVTQCDGSANGGGASLICNVHVTNQLVDPTNSSTTSPATVDECAGSGSPGTAPTTVCNPTSTVTNATITQCNGSGNGGTASLIVLCDVGAASTVSSAIPVLIDQCNGSSNGGGATVVCGSTLEFQLLTLANDTATQPAASVTDNGVTNYTGTPTTTGGSSGSGTPGSGSAIPAPPTLAVTGGVVGLAPLLALIAILGGVNLALFAKSREAATALE